MFKNIGKKIQGYSKLVFALEVFVSMFAAMLVIGVLGSILYGDDAEIIPIIGGGIVLVGVFFAWLGQMRLYAYGKITECCETMMKTMERMEAMQRSQIPMRKCASCGAVLDGDAVFCPECGTKNEQ